jgi:hypothetical protein
MAAPDLHKFRDDLKNRPAPGSNAPPVSIRAKDLDENYKKVTVVKPSIIPAGLQPDYEMRYRKDGSEVILRAAVFDVCENGAAVKYRLLGQRKY